MSTRSSCTSFAAVFNASVGFATRRQPNTPIPWQDDSGVRAGYWKTSPVTLLEIESRPSSKISGYRFERYFASSSNISKHASRVTALSTYLMWASQSCSISATLRSWYRRKLESISIQRFQSIFRIPIVTKFGPCRKGLYARGLAVLRSKSLAGRGKGVSNRGCFFDAVGRLSLSNVHHTPAPMMHNKNAISNMLTLNVVDACK
jgi:hypothetical protein